MSRSRSEYDEAERFAQDVDRLLAGQPVAETGDDAYRADLALAQQVSQGRFVPDPGFASRLRRDLLNHMHDKEENTMSQFGVLRSLVRPLAIAAVAAMVVFGIVFVVSPDVRAAAQEWVARFVEVGSGDELLPPSVEGQPLDSIGFKAAEDGLDAPNLLEENLTVPDEGLAAAPAGIEAARDLVSLEEAQANVDFRIRMPSTLPKGYSFLGVTPTFDTPDLAADAPALPADAPKVESPQSVMLLFGNSSGKMLVLVQMRVAGPTAGEVPLPAGEGSVQDVEINGQPGQYIEGRWTPDGWVSNGNYHLHWQDAEGIMYDLFSETLRLKKLLAVANSIQ